MERSMIAVTVVTLGFFLFCFAYIAVREYLMKREKKMDKHIEKELNRVLDQKLWQVQAERERFLMEMRKAQKDAWHSVQNMVIVARDQALSEQTTK